MAKIDIEWEHDFPNQVKDLIQNMVEGLWEACRIGVDIIGNESEKEAPLDVGFLRNSWTVTPLTTEIGFRMGYHTPYAARLHEHPEYNFRTPGTKGKYLEDPIEQNKGDWQGHFLNKLKQVSIK